jgi:hypothetical protein
MAKFAPKGASMFTEDNLQHEESQALKAWHRTGWDKAPKDAKRWIGRFDLQNTSLKSRGLLGQHLRILANLRARQWPDGRRKFGPKVYLPGRGIVRILFK